VKAILVLARFVLVDNFRSWTRALLALFGVAVAVCLMIWIIRGYDAATAPSPAPQTQTQAGRFDVVVAPKDRMRGQQFPADVLQTIRTDESIAELDPALRTRLRIVKP